MMYKPWRCNKCGAPMYGPNEHSTTAGCNVRWPATVTTGDTGGFVTSGPTIWGSEEPRRLSRYDESIRLLNKWLKPGQYPVTETKAFLAEEPK